MEAYLLAALKTQLPRAQVQAIPPVKGQPKGELRPQADNQAAFSYSNSGLQEPEWAPAEISQFWPG